MTTAQERHVVDSELRTILHVPARDVPIPAHLSPEAQAQLAQGSLSNPSWPPLNDIGSWRRLIATMDEMGLAGLTMIGQHVKAEVQQIDAQGVRVFVVTRATGPPGIRLFISTFMAALCSGEGVRAAARWESSVPGWSAQRCGRSTIACRRITLTRQRWTTV